MSDTRKRLCYSGTIFIRAEPELREAVAAAAARERTTQSEFIRRGLRAALAHRGEQANREGRMPND
jgi:predicted HicB family RNase H-like nuclease